MKKIIITAILLVTLSVQADDIQLAKTHLSDAISTTNATDALKWAQVIQFLEAEQITAPIAQLYGGIAKQFEPQIQTAPLLIAAMIPMALSGASNPGDKALLNWLSATNRADAAVAAIKIPSALKADKDIRDAEWKKKLSSNNR